MRCLSDGFCVEDVGASFVAVDGRSASCVVFGANPALTAVAGIDECGAFASDFFTKGGFFVVVFEKTCRFCTCFVAGDGVDRAGITCGANPALTAVTGIMECSFGAFHFVKKSRNG